MSQEELRFVDAVNDEHFAAMSRLHAEGWRTTYNDIFSADYFQREITDDRWIPVFRNNHATGAAEGLIAYCGDKPVSCISYGPARLGIRPDGKPQDFDFSAYAGWGEIHSIYSDPTEIGKGYGNLIFGESCRRLKAAGHTHCFVLVNEKKPLSIKFYTDHGFMPDGTHMDWDYEGVICVNLRYCKELV